MNTEAIEALLAGAEETDALEFKGAVSWDRNLFVKDILGLRLISAQPQAH